MKSGVLLQSQGKGTGAVRVVRDDDQELSFSDEPMRRRVMLTKLSLAAVGFSAIITGTIFIATTAWDREDLWDWVAELSTVILGMIMAAFFLDRGLRARRVRILVIFDLGIKRRFSLLELEGDDERELFWKDLAELEEIEVVRAESRYGTTPDYWVRLGFSGDRRVYAFATDQLDWADAVAQRIATISGAGVFHPESIVRTHGIGVDSEVDFD